MVVIKNNKHNIFLKSLYFKVFVSNLTVQILLIPNFIKVLTQIINKNSKIQQNE
jgi:hypothetical protein